MTVIRRYRFKKNHLSVHLIYVHFIDVSYASIKLKNHKRKFKLSPFCEYN